MKTLIYKNSEITWKTVCYNRAMPRHITEMQILAAKLAYPFLCWNDRIYYTEDLADTGFTIEVLDC